MCACWWCREKDILKGSVEKLSFIRGWRISGVGGVSIMSAHMCIDAYHSDGGSGGGRVVQCLDAALHVGSVCDIARLCDSVVGQKEGAL